MTYENLLETARACGNAWLKTSTGRRFRVGVYLDCPFFIPESTGLGRSDGRRAAEAIVNRYNATRAFGQSTIETSHETRRITSRWLYVPRTWTRRCLLSAAEAVVPSRHFLDVILCLFIRRHAVMPLHSPAAGIISRKR